MARCLQLGWRGQHHSRRLQIPGARRVQNHPSGMRSGREPRACSSAAGLKTGFLCCAANRWRQAGKAGELFDGGGGTDYEVSEQAVQAQKTQKTAEAMVAKRAPPKTVDAATAEKQKHHNNGVSRSPGHTRARTRTCPPPQLPIDSRRVIALTLRPICAYAISHYRHTFCAHSFERPPPLTVAISKK